ncbi:MAG: helix-turn-helix domain-containing protein [Ruminococcus sp.]|nr:helix-turn-helix domain-containing protein [Ruminococcus sp.]
MAEMMTVKQASERWNIFDTRITKLCREGRIPGVVKNGKSWLIPIGTPKPADNRYKKQPVAQASERLPLPFGVSEYRLASTNTIISIKL